MKLNIGCARDYREGYINCDISREVKADKYFDFNKKFPFEDNSVNEVLAIHILEHLTNPLGCLAELYRICKPGAEIRITVPHGFSVMYCQDLTHHSRFTYFGLDYLNVDEQGNYTNPLHHEYGDMKFHVRRRFYFRKWFRVFGLDWFFNKLPKVYEGYLIGIFPATELKFELEVIK